MALEDYRFLPHTEVSPIFAQLSDEAFYASIVPELSSLVIVKDPREVLTQAERNLITTGLEDEMLLATFKLMPVPLRFVLRRGYCFDFNNEEQREFVQMQKPRFKQSTDLLRIDLRREPTEQERAVHYSVNGGLQYFIDYAIRNLERARKTGFVSVPRDIRVIEEELAVLPINGMDPRVLYASLDTALVAA